LPVCWRVARITTATIAVSLEIGGFEAGGDGLSLCRKVLRRLSFRSGLVERLVLFGVFGIHHVGGAVDGRGRLRR